MTGDLVPARQASTVVDLPSRPLVHELVRDQLVDEIGRKRINDLYEVLDDATCNEVLHWLSSAKRAALTTKRAYAEDLVKFAGWACQHFGHRPLPLLQVMTPDAVTVWTVYARSQKMSVRTQRRMLSTVSSLFTYASKHGWTIANPVNFEDHARPVGTSDNGRPVGATRVLDVDELAQLWEACQTAEERLVFDLLYLQGLRESEIANACAEHVKRDHYPAVLMVQRKRGQWAERELLPRTQMHLDEHLAGRAEGPLLVNPKTGESKTRHQIIDITRRLARRGKLPNANTVTPHVLRASAITELLNGGEPIQEVQKWAGHSSSKTTQGYWERSNAVKRDAALTGGLAAALDKAVAGVK